MPPRDYYKSKSFSGGSKKSKPSRPSGPRGGDRAGPSKPSRPSRPSGGGGPPGRGDTAPSRAAIESAQRANRAAKERQQKREKEQQQQQKENLLQKAKNVVMRKGEHVSDPASLTKKSWEAAGKVPTGQHKLRSQYDRLAAKYGPGWEKTSQAQQLANYLSGVPVERGGGRGAQDPTYGGLTSWDQLDPDSEAYRQQLLEEMSTKAGRPGGGGIAGLKGIDVARARGNLTPDQYFNFRQQLMQADPASYRQAFPLASGNLLQGVASLAPGIGMAGRVLKGALGKAQDVGQGIAQSIPSGLMSLFNKAKGVVTPAGGQGGGGGGQQFAYQQELPVSRPIGQEEIAPPYQGVIGGMPGMYQPGYGGSIGKENEMRTAVFQDRDGDGVDDRDQSGPGQPHWRGSMGQGQKFATLEEPGVPSQRILPRAPSALTPGGALEMSPITHQLQFQQPNWQQWNQNIRRFPGVR